MGGILVARPTAHANPESNMTTFFSRIDLFETEARALLDFIAGIPQESWAADSACEGWTVADVIGHLTSVDLSSRLTRGLAGPEHLPARRGCERASGR